MKLTPKIQKAINLAAFLHRNQKRRIGHWPFIVHPYSVAFILANYTKDEDVIIAGLLHDVLEDVKTYSSKKMREDFGSRVTKIVEEVSEKESGLLSRRESWEERKKGYIKKLKRDSQEAMMVCAADKIQNLESLIEDYKKRGSKIWSEFDAPKDKKMWFYSEVVKILKNNLKNKIVRELEIVYNRAQKKLGS